MPKKIVNAFLSNRIYLANVKKDGTMSDSGRQDITDDVVYAMFQKMKTMYERDGKSRFIIDGIGEIQFTPENELIKE